MELMENKANYIESEIPAFKFQLFSDIHLENYKKFPLIPPLTPYLFLAGDIGSISDTNFAEFFDYCSQNWTKVFYVLGNHEYYHQTKTMNKLYVEYEIFFQQRYSNVFILYDNAVDIDDNLCVYGTTLWTKPPFKDAATANLHINDYKHIWYGAPQMDGSSHKPELITTDHIKNTSEKQLQELTKFLATTKKRTIVMTHFPPTQYDTISPKHYGQDPMIRNYFAWNITDIMDIFDNDRLIAWFSGHTHYSYDLMVEGVRLLSNQIGNCAESTNFKEDGVFELDGVFEDCDVV